MKDSNQRDASADDKHSVTAVFAERLRYWRRERGLSLKALAEKSGVSETSLISYEQNRKIAGIDKLVALARALDVSTIDLIGEIAPPADSRAFLEWRIMRCLKTLQEAEYLWYWDKDASRIIINLPPKLIRTDDGIVISHGNSPVVMDESAFVAIFERIADTALGRADLKQIVAEEIRRL